MRTLHQLCRLPVLLIALCASAIAARADDPEREPVEEPGTPDTTLWQCRWCPYPDGWFGTLAFGPGWVSDASPKFGDYRGLEDSGGFASLSGDLHYRDDHHYLDLYARELGRDSRRVELRGGRPGRYEVRIGWQQIPKLRGFGTETPYRGIGSGTLTLPPDWQPATTTTGFDTLAASLQPVALGLDRSILSAGLSLHFPGHWSYEVDYHHEDKNGTRPFGAGVYLIDTEQFPVPVDFTTDRFDIGLSFAAERGHLRLGFTGSEFRNGNTSVTWQNPFSAQPGTDTLQAALEPDNRFYQLSLAGSYTPNRRLHLSGRAAWGQMEQDDPFVPHYSLNPQFSDWPLPRLSLDGSVDSRTLYVAGRMVLRLGDSLDLVASAKRDERDNDTPVDTWTPVITDLVPRATGPNLPYSFDRERYRMELRQRFEGGLRLGTGGEYERVRRTLQDADTTRETTWWGEAGLDRWSLVSLRLRLERAHRDFADYRARPNGGLIEHPLQRKFHLANRDRSRAVFEIDVVPADRVGLSLAWYRGEDEYDESVVGLQRSSEDTLTLDANYAASESINIYAFATREDIESTMTGAVSDGAPLWYGFTDDRFTTLGGGVTWRTTDRISLGLEYVRADADGGMRVDTGAGEAPFPDIETRLGNARLRLDYRFDTHWSGKLYAEYERYDSNDWTVDGLGPAGIPAVLGLGADSPDYDVLVLRLLATCRF